MDHKRLAKDLFVSGCNCAQAVFCAFCDKTGMDFDTAKKLSSSFGGGMGRMREVCGAVSGMFMVAGYLYGYSDTENALAKAEHYSLIRLMAEKFKQETGSIICRELLETCEVGGTPEKRTAEYYKKRPCAELVEICAGIMDEIIAEKEESDQK